MDVSYEKMVAEMRNTSYADLGAAAGRSWVWQTCNEFGYFQSSDGSADTQVRPADLLPIFVSAKIVQFYNPFVLCCQRNVPSSAHSPSATSSRWTSQSNNAIIFINCRRRLSATLLRRRTKSTAAWDLAENA